ncbi:hypothetical protein AGMMS49936_11950 [Endomicrobiia bacterium]|nr:hypothetical protein AGMMS49936_11950 [Endomicrobiia bacterium]
MRQRQRGSKITSYDMRQTGGTQPESEGMNLCKVIKKFSK